MAKKDLEKEIERLVQKRDELEIKIKKKREEEEQMLQSICWDALQPHVLDRERAFRFKRAIENDTIISLLFEENMLPKKVMEAIKESEEEKADEK